MKSKKVRNKLRLSEMKRDFGKEVFREFKGKKWIKNIREKIDNMRKGEKGIVGKEERKGIFEREVKKREKLEILRYIKCIYKVERKIIGNEGLNLKEEIKSK